ncbi:hypothetical protein BKA70DRAFT_1436799 [Coprinopsis sp. MPI-PUGE-AT-0042]|nr:hypothetical protein BKA70DRAFT_1436799 [Coprinopsis sp. MPI-PUGE-AT-0042]
MLQVTTFSPRCLCLSLEALGRANVFRPPPIRKTSSSRQSQLLLPPVKTDADLITALDSLVLMVAISSHVNHYCTSTLDNSKLLEGGRTQEHIVLSFNALLNPPDKPCLLSPPRLIHFRSHASLIFVVFVGIALFYSEPPF